MRLVARPSVPVPPERLLFTIEQASVVSGMSRNRISELIKFRRVVLVPHPYGAPIKLLPFDEVLTMSVAATVLDATGGGTDGQNRRFVAIRTALRATPGADRHGYVIAHDRDAEWVLSTDEAIGQLETGLAVWMVSMTALRRRLLLAIEGAQVVCSDPST